jgi:hypothetical protein
VWGLPEWDFSGGYFYAPFEGRVYAKGKPGNGGYFRAPFPLPGGRPLLKVDVTLDMNARTIEWTPQAPQQQQPTEGEKNSSSPIRIIAYLKDEDTTLYPAILAGTVTEYFIISR